MGTRRVLLTAPAVVAAIYLLCYGKPALLTGGVLFPYERHVSGEGAVGLKKRGGSSHQRNKSCQSDERASWGCRPPGTPIEQGSGGSRRREILCFSAVGARVALSYVPQHPSCCAPA